MGRAAWILATRKPLGSLKQRRPRLWCMVRKDGPVVGRRDDTLSGSGGLLGYHFEGQVMEVMRKVETGEAKTND